MLVTAAELAAFAPNLTKSAVGALTEALNIELPKAGIKTLDAFWGFLAQTHAETDGYLIKRESLKYRPPRLVEVFGPGVSSAAVTPAEAVVLCAKGEVAIGNRVYGTGKLAKDLGNTEPNDGFDKRGFGILQHTGRAITVYLAHHMGLDDVEAAPDLIANDFMLSVRAAGLEWNAHKCSEVASDFKELTRHINGGLNGYADRLKALARAKRIWPAEAMQPRLAAAADVPVTPLTPAKAVVKDDGQIVVATATALAAPTSAIKRTSDVPEEVRSLLASALRSQTKDPKMLQYISDRMAERSTYQGLILLLGAVGVTLRPDMQDAVISVGIAVGGLLHVLFPQSGNAKQG